VAERVRLQKFLANAGIASRRKAEELIIEGRVAVNDVIVTELGTRVDPESDRVTVDRKTVVAATVRWIAMHKPAGYLTSRGDPHGRPTIYDLLPPEHRGLFYVGRLDFDTEGLVLLTNDGDRAHRLQHPSFQVPRVYEATVGGELSEDVVQRLLQGVILEDGPARVLDAELRTKGPRASTIRVTLAEGRKREVRRLFEAVGYPVARLVRLRYGPISLGSLPVGEWRDLSDPEKAQLES
jgi:23S rRNA pseudouridine2605 synthase